ncbi:MAG: hypothetical protein ABIR15_04530 [Chitinophagaceae bacterium]
MYNKPLHSFHIPVMGLAFTIDSPVKVARFGISSVISIVEDKLIEMMRGYYYARFKLTFTPIPANENDFRAKRITDYLNLVNKIVLNQMDKIRNEAFETGSEIVKYFNLLPDQHPMKALYQKMNDTVNQEEKENIASLLRKKMVPGSIDVNIMTKLDKNNYENGELLEDGSDAVASLRGYVDSDLSNSSVVFSAGLNPRLYNYLEKCRQFDTSGDGFFKKKVTVKVSDYRSALIQGKYLAKKGIWVSEFRIESGLNCGGHAFATDGLLMGPILEEFKTKKQELIDTMYELYSNVLKSRGGNIFKHAPAVKITAQGGIGTAGEDQFLRQHYGIEGTGWGSPFLLVPEATTVDAPLLQQLSNAKTDDIILSNNSPLGVRFHYLKGTSGERLRLQRIKNGKAGSPCTEKHLVSNTEFTAAPICTASHKYQQLKIAQLKTLQIPAAEYEQKLKAVTDKECLCVGLSNAAANHYNIKFVKGRTEENICPGPNIAWFSKEVSLETMVGHIYGRNNIITDEGRPHMFIAELNLYLTYLQEEIDNDKTPGLKKEKFILEFSQNLMKGISYYSNLFPVTGAGNANFHKALDSAAGRLQAMTQQPQAVTIH